MSVSKEEVEAMIKDAHKTADRSLGEKNEWSVKASQLLGDQRYERIRNWICVEPVSNGLAILLAFIIIIID